MATKEKLAVIIPALNEADTLEETVLDVATGIVSLPFESRIILVDDGSTDDTWKTMQALAERHGCEAHRNPRNLGLGRTVMNTWDIIEPGSWVNVHPGDNEFIFSSIQNLVDVRAGCDIVFGYLGNPVIRPITRRLMSYAFTKTAATMYGFDFRYLNGMKLYKVDVFRGIDVESNGHSFNAELLAKTVLRNPGVKIGQAPFLARGRSTGVSKAARPTNVVKEVRDMAKGLRSVTNFRRKVATKSGF